MFPNLLQTNLLGLLREPLTLHTYGLLIAVGFLLGMTMVRRQAAAEGLDPEAMVDLTFALLLSGLVGARVVFIMTKLHDFLEHPAEILMFWRGGLVWYGGFLGAIAYLLWVKNKQQLNFFKTVDLLIVPMALAHAFGRIGCLFAGCCFGRLTTLPWGIVFPPGSFAQQAHAALGLVRMAEPALAVHPTQLYEAWAEFFLFVFLIWVRRHKRFDGQLFLWWMALYSIVRSVIELFRGDAERGVYILSTSQYISIAVGVATLLMIAKLRGRQMDVSAG